MSKVPDPHRAPYLDPHTGILTKLIGACTTTELATAEADLVTAHSRQLFHHPPAPTRDLAELQAIHPSPVPEHLSLGGVAAHRGPAQNGPGGAAVPTGVVDHSLGGFRLRSSNHSRRLVAGLDPGHRAVNDAASRAAAEDHDLAALQEMFAVILTPAQHHWLPRS